MGQTRIQKDEINTSGDAGRYARAAGPAHKSPRLPEPLLRLSRLLGRLSLSCLRRVGSLRTSLGSPVARSPNALGRAVDRSGVEAHAPQNRMEIVVVSVALLACLPLSHAPPGVSIPRSSRPPRQTLRHQLTSGCPASARWAFRLARECRCDRRAQ